MGLLRETLIGKAVAPFRKAGDPNIAATAASLVRRWKEAAALAAAATVAAEAAQAGGGGECGTVGGGERRPAEEKQRAVEEGFKCRTWESLYQVRSGRGLPHERGFRFCLIVVVVVVVVLGFWV